MTILGVASLIARPAVTLTRGGKQITFVVLFLLPVITAWMGAAEQWERTKQTQFCLSCHIMEPYGKSLLVDDATYLPAAHYQNARIPRDQACYTCHTDYALYGTALTKIRGLHHLYAQYLGSPMNPLQLYTPYNNRVCLHCHSGARSFEEGLVHSADPSIVTAIKSNELSCVSAGCHQTMHNVADLGGVEIWEPPANE